MKNTWSNIQISPHDQEIVEINNFQQSLGKLPQNIIQIRELITRFEVCHFKYQEHLDKIKNSIFTLLPNIAPDKIGINHIQHDENAWRNDSTGRALIGQQYLWSLRKWLDNESQNELAENYNRDLNQNIHKWLGRVNPEKNHLVRLLLARLTWDWKAYEELHGGAFEELEYQASRIDICHYAFPQNLNLILRGIGKMEPVKKFEGCGLYNQRIKAYIEKKFAELNRILVFMREIESSDINHLSKIWLLACLVKTLKEQINLQKPIAKLITKLLQK